MSEQEFEAYLRLMGRFLRLSDEQRQTIGLELRGHMEERLDELLTRGYAREDAINTILDEFGDAACLASEFGRIGLRRKWIMRTTLGTAGIAAAILLVSFLLPENRPLPGPAYIHAGENAPAMLAAPTVAEKPVVPVAGSPRAIVETAVWPSADAETDRQIRAKLATTLISVDFPEGTAFEEVLNFLGQESGLPIAVNWNDLGTMGLDRATDTLGINLKDTKLETVLRILLDHVGELSATVDYMIADGVIRISSRLDLDRQTVVRVYDCQDLISRSPQEILAAVTAAQSAAAQNAAAPGMVPGGGGLGGTIGFGGGGFGGGGFGGGTPPRESAGLLADYERVRRELEAERAGDLEQIIKTTVQPGTWEPKGKVGVISHYNGLLVINTSPRVHHRVLDLLTVMRQAMAARSCDHATSTQARATDEPSETTELHASAIRIDADGMRLHADRDGVRMVRTPSTRPAEAGGR